MQTSVQKHPVATSSARAIAEQLELEAARCAGVAKLLNIMSREPEGTTADELAVLEDVLQGINERISELAVRARGGRHG